MRNRTIGDINDFGMRAIVRREFDNVSIREVLLEFGDKTGITAPKTVNRLVGIANCIEFCVARAEQTKHLKLHSIYVLELIHREDIPPRLQCAPRRLTTRQQPQVCVDRLIRIVLKSFHSRRTSQ